MKYVNYLMLLVAMVLSFVGLYYWLALGQLDQAALYIALGVGVHTVYLHSVKAQKPA